MRIGCQHDSMRQLSIKNDRAVELLERITRSTGEDTTEAVVQAFELCQAQLLSSAGAERVIASIRTAVHPYVSVEHRGRAPTNEENGAELEMP